MSALRNLTWKLRETAHMFLRPWPVPFARFVLVYGVVCFLRRSYVYCVESFRIYRDAEQEENG